ncbi:MAG: DUF4919 domain-containing protein [Prevotella sp.]|nr:DUF4919 domain-containing protein [Prevotella sp.]
MFYKVNFEEYAHSYNNKLMEDFRQGRLWKFQQGGTMRKLMYGYTFTPEYASGEVDDALSVDYWEELARNGGEANGCVLDQSPSPYYKVKTVQARKLLETIFISGEGKTPGTAYSVISVQQEYEFINHFFPYYMMEVKRQVLVGEGIDRIEFEDHPYGVKQVYFDVHRYMDVMLKH